MLTRSDLTYSDLVNQARANYAWSRGISECDVYIITRQDENNMWYAHMGWVQSPDLTEKGPVVIESDQNLDKAMLKLHVTSAKVTHAEYKRRENQSFIIIGPTEGQDDGEDSEDDSDSTCSGSGDEAAVDRNKTEARTRTAPFKETFSAKGAASHLQVADTTTLPRADRMLTNSGPFAIGHESKPTYHFSTHPSATLPHRGPPIFNPKSAIRNLPPPQVPVHIFGHFVNHYTFDFKTVIPLTRKDVLTAATRWCSRPGDINRLYSSLKSVARGGMTRVVDGGVEDLMALVGSLPQSKSLPDFEVQIIEGPGV